MSDIDPKSFFPAQPFGDISEVTPLTGGLSGDAVFVVETQAGGFVLRLFKRDRSQWEQGVIMQALAAERGVAPQLVLVDKYRSATISSKVKGVPLGFAAAQPELRDAVLASLAAQIRALHQTPTAGLGPRQPLRMGQQLWQSQSRRPGFPAWALPLGDKLILIERQLATDTRLVFSHCDLNPANGIWDGQQVWFVDWDGAGLAHPYLDAAVAANFLVLSASEARRLLQAQEADAVSVEQEATFAALRALAYLIYGCVFLSLAPDLTAVTFADRPTTLTLSQCFERLARGELNLQSPSGQALVGAALLRALAAS